MPATYIGAIVVTSSSEMMRGLVSIDEVARRTSSLRSDTAAVVTDCSSGDDDRHAVRRRRARAARRGSRASLSRTPGAGVKRASQASVNSDSQISDAVRLVQRPQRRRQVQRDHRGGDPELQTDQRERDAHGAQHGRRLTPPRECRSIVRARGAREETRAARCVNCTCCAGSAAASEPPHSGKPVHAPLAPGILAVSPPKSTVTSAIAAAAAEPRAARTSPASRASTRRPPSPPARSTAAASAASSSARDSANAQPSPRRCCPCAP